MEPPNCVEQSYIIAQFAVDGRAKVLDILEPEQ
jgi:hypothetical protein